MEQGFIYFLLTVLLSLLAWIGNRIHIKIDSLTDKIEAKLDEVNKTLSGIERDLKEDLIEHDKRITALENVVVISGRKHGRAN
jgi:hypothetical protein